MAANAAWLESLPKDRQDAEYLVQRVIWAAANLGLLVLFCERVVVQRLPFPVQSGDVKVKGEPVEVLRRQVSHALVSTLATLYLGVNGLLIGLHYSNNDHSASENFKLLDATPEQERVGTAVHGLAEKYAGYLLYKVMMWSLGWEASANNVVFYAGGLCLCSVLVPNEAYPRLGMWGMATEVATPLLLLSEVFVVFQRSVLAGVFRSVWVGAYLTTAFVFTYEVLSAVLVVFDTPNLYPMCLSAHQNYLVLSLFLAAWLTKVYEIGSLFDKVMVLVGIEPNPKSV